MRHFFIGASVVLLAAWALAQSLTSNVGTIRLTARLAPHVVVASSETPPGVTARQLANDRLVIHADAGSPVSIPFTFAANTRSARIHIGAHQLDTTFDVVPVKTSCDWVHGSRSAAENRVAAVLFRCRPTEVQLGAVELGARKKKTSLTLVVEPIENWPHS